MSKTKKVVGFVVLIVVVGIVILSAPNILSFIQQLGYTRLTLPIGAFVYSTQGKSEYTFRYGGLLANESGLLQVWISGYAFPRDIAIRDGATYAAFGIEIKISERHEDYIVILVKPTEFGTQ